MVESPSKFLKEAFSEVPMKTIKSVMAKNNGCLEGASQELLQRSITASAVATSTLLMTAPSNHSSHGRHQRNAFDAIMSKDKSTLKPNQPKSKKMDRTPPAALPAKSFINEQHNAEQKTRNTQQQHYRLDS